MVRTIVPTSRYDVGGGSGRLIQQYFDDNALRPADLKTEQVTVTITGSEEVMKNLSRVIASAHDKAFLRLRQNGERILSAAKMEVPWDTTHLLQTGTVEVIKGGSFTAKYWEEGMDNVATRVESADGEEDGIIMVGFNTPYALVQHEDLSMYHPKPGRKAKYLEDPAMRIAPTIAADIVNAIRGELGI